MEKATETWVMPEDRPRNICFNKVLDTAADCDVALRRILAITNGSIGQIACIGATAASDADDTARIYPMTAEELIDCCEKGCCINYSNSVTGESVCIKPFQWGVVPVESASLSYAYAVFLEYEVGATTSDTTAVSPTAFVVLSSELITLRDSAEFNPS